MKKNNLLILITVTIILMIFVRLASAETGKVQVKLDGLVCTFCAYNLEKKIKRIEGVKDLKILVNEGLAEIKIGEDKSIDVDGIKKAVKEGGFTPREIIITLKGRIEEASGRMILRTDYDSFILKYNKILKEIITSEKAQGETITVTGLVQEEKIKGHGIHPYVLEIKNFKLE
ncbi:MAG: Heavy-metal-associated domain protein [Candidatus Scalindua rubra]|uniref:Heavy-metal-associated domain protein n=1 Tax=Candidatus Scalindua rubra TaxID=1872076 RepID=A0A1E3X5W8_9BACT|nr:MAG: Heavy-metal-associated domain protein [Candidatus Scalindua rubra]